MRQNSYRFAPALLLPAFLLSLAILLALPISHSASFYPEHSLVLEHNLNLTKAPREAALPPDVNASPATFGHPFSFAYVRVLEAMPSVDARVSDLHRPKILWVWGESNGGSLKKTVPGCEDSEYTLTAAGNPQFFGTMFFSVQGRQYQQPTSSATVDVPAEFWKNISVKEGENSTPLLPDFTATVAGEIIVLYYYTEKVCSTQSDGVPGPGGGVGGKGEVCRCDEKAEFRNISSGEISNSKTWQVEVGKPSFFMLLPIVAEQLSFRPKLQALAFSSRKPAQLTLLYNGGELNSSILALFELNESGFGHLHVVSQESRLYGKNLSGRPSVPQSGIAASLAAANGTKFLLPTSLDPSNSSYAYQYFLASNASLPAGEGNLTAYFVDMFDDEFNASFRISVRDLSQISLGNSSAQAVIIGPDGLPYAYVQPRTQPRNFSTQFDFAGNSSVRPSSAIAQKFPQPAAIPLAILGPIALFALLLWYITVGREKP